MMMMMSLTRRDVIGGSPFNKRDATPGTVKC
jgi:hypothetical protein